MTSLDLRSPELTQKWRHLTVSDVEGSLECGKLAYTAHFTSYKAVGCCGRESHHRKWRHVPSGDQKWPGSDVIRRKVTWKWL